MFIVILRETTKKITLKYNKRKNKRIKMVHWKISNTKGSHDG